jgi:hypothetical protein
MPPTCESNAKTPSGSSKFATLQLDLLELRLVEPNLRLGHDPACDGGQLGIRLDRLDDEPARDKRPRELACPAADLDDGIARPEVGARARPVDQAVGIARPDALVLLGHPAEAQPGLSRRQ